MFSPLTRRKSSLFAPLLPAIDGAYHAALPLPVATTLAAPATPALAGGCVVGVMLAAPQSAVTVLAFPPALPVRPSLSAPWSLLIPALIPALPLSIPLSAPQSLRDLALTPALSIRPALSAPQWTRDIAVNVPCAVRYRLYLSGGTGTIELPLASFQCRRRSGAPTWISVVVPIAASSVIDEIEARIAGQLIIHKGVALASGIEQLDEMMRADLDRMSYDYGAESASVTLDGYLETTNSTPKTRAITGICYRNLSDGIRRVRCEVDTWLAPGDTADLGGGETLLVSEIVAWVGTTQSYMEITEAGD